LNRARFCALVLSAALCGCATSEPPRPGANKPATVTQSINLSGYSPEYRKGFTEGCSAAKGQGGTTRPKGESQYANGWGDGHEYCAPRKRI
jgi:hypothetical protein